MRYNTIYALIVSVFVLAQAANAQQIPAATAQLNAVKAPEPAGVAPNGAPAAAGTAAAAAALSAGASPTGAPNVVTLGQAATTPSTPSSSAPPIVPAIQGNSVLATGSNAKLLDSAGPRIEADQRPKAPPISLVRISDTDGDLRALLKIHGVTRYVEVGSKVKKMVVSSISDDGVCLVNPGLTKTTSRPKKQKSTASGCAQLISF